MANCGAEVPIVLTLLPPSPTAATIPQVNPIRGLLLHILLYISLPIMELDLKEITNGEPDSAPPGTTPPVNPSKECCNKNSTGRR